MAVVPKGLSRIGLTRTLTTTVNLHLIGDTVARDTDDCSDKMAFVAESPGVNQRESSDAEFSRNRPLQTVRDKTDEENRAKTVVRV